MRFLRNFLIFLAVFAAVLLVPAGAAGLAEKSMKRDAAPEAPPALQRPDAGAPGCTPMEWRTRGIEWTE